MLLPARTGDIPTARSASIARLGTISAEAWLLTAATILGAVLRFATISKQSYWLDEALALRELHGSFGSMLSSIANEPNPPLFFIVAWPWAKLFGTSEAGVRSLSAIAGTAVIPISYLCGRELVSKRAGVVAAVLVAVSPFMIWYSQEAREYMLLALLCSASFLFWARAWRRGSTRDVAWWAVFSALAMVTHYFTAFLLIAEALALLWRVRSRAVLFAIGTLVVVGVALLPHFLAHASRPSGWIGVSALSLRLRQLPITFALGYQTSTVGWGLLGAAALAAIVIALLVIAGSDAELRGAGLAAGIGLSVLLLPLGLAAVGHDYYVPRALIAAWVPLAVVLGAACTVSRARAPGAGLAVVAVCAFVVGGITIDSDAGYQKPPWRAVAAALGRASGPRAVVAYNGGFAAVPLALYMHGDALGPGTAKPFTVSEIDVVGASWQATAVRLRGGVQLAGAQQVGGYLVKRYVLPAPVQLTPAQIATRGRALFGSGPPDPSILIQRASA